MIDWLSRTHEVSNLTLIAVLAGLTLFGGPASRAGRRAYRALKRRLGR